jgi:hypothetical protein
MPVVEETAALKRPSSKDYSVPVYHFTTNKGKARLMKITLAYFFIAVTVILISPKVEAQKPASSDGKQGAIQLFNGKDLSGWYTFLKDRGRNEDPLKVFTVSDGIIRISGEEYGCITSLDEFENYRLVMEFKWGERTFGGREKAARDSGMLVHSVGEDGAYGGMWMYSIECQMIEGGTGDILVVGDGTNQYEATAPVAEEMSNGCHVFKPNGKPVTINSGRINWFGRDPEWEDVKGFRGKQDVEKPIGEWNTYECIVAGKTLTIILNGVTVNHCFDVQPSRGRIQIQSEGAELFVRRIDVMPLAASDTKP